MQHARPAGSHPARRPPAALPRHARVRYRWPRVLVQQQRGADRLVLAHDRQGQRRPLASLDDQWLVPAECAPQQGRALERAPGRQVCRGRSSQAGAASARPARLPPGSRPRRLRSPQVTRRRVRRWRVGLEGRMSSLQAVCQVRRSHVFLVDRSAGDAVSGDESAGCYCHIYGWYCPVGLCDAALSSHSTTASARGKYG